MTINPDISKKEITKEVLAKSSSTLSSQEKEKLKNAAYDFQSVLIGQMLKSMRDSQLSGEDEDEGYGSEIYNELFDMQMAQYMSRSSNFGIAEKIYKDLTGEELTGSKIIPTSNEKSSNIVPQTSNNSNNTIKTTSKSNSLYDKVTEYENIINKAAEKYDVEPNLIKAIIATESGGNQTAVSKANAKGLMQLMDSTAKDLGVTNSFNAYQNILGGTKYISEMLEKYQGNLDLALAAYNAGPGAVDKYDGIPPYDETQKYIDTVKNYMNTFSQKEQELSLNE
jgi:soluble lytic murein transglycosylase-like protein